MSRSVARARAAAVAVAAMVLGCVSVKTSDNSGGKDAAPAGLDAVAAPDSRAPDAVAAGPKTCREIRICVFNCREDAACASRCASTAAGPARAQYQQAQMCSLQACPNQDPDCRCNEECHGGGACTVAVDECDEAVSDPFCDGPCH
jgi:hypothetical protein